MTQEHKECDALDYSGYAPGVCPHCGTVTDVTCFEVFRTAFIFRTYECCNPGCGRYFGTDSRFDLSTVPLVGSDLQALSDDVFKGLRTAVKQEKKRRFKSFQEACRHPVSEKIGLAFGRMSYEVCRDCGVGR